MTGIPSSRLIVIGLLAVLARHGMAAPEVAETSIGEAKRDGAGLLVHSVRSPFEAGTTTIRVLLPDSLDPAKSYPVVYVLPVEAGDEHKYGDGLLEAKRDDLQNKYRAIFVAPTFSRLPWYADHPTDPEIRQETYFLKVVVPLVEKTYPARHDAGGRLLVGFSKSGWGAFSLLLRHPDLFGKASAWDAPLMMDAPGKYGSGDIFGTPENFGHYRISHLLEQRAAELGPGKRLILLGYGNFRDDCGRADALMRSLKIEHVFRDGPRRAHVWSSGWLPEAVQFLFAGAAPDPTSRPATPDEGAPSK
jgi:esterase/lipase superfamily enzyme